MVWLPHVTVAAIVEKDGKFLMVEERDENGELVWNQPAGHLEANETLLEAVVRETLEETRWKVEPTALLNIQLYHSPRNDITYLRTNLVATAIDYCADCQLDAGIQRELWLSADDIFANKPRLRSDLVWQAIKTWQTGVRHPLSVLQAYEND